ncbi:MAG TPA: flagellar biosynthetic protein FliR [Peptococcaceae bacterium]|jgi:flagellar biosynthetic protein FliR|nr:flagellar biosynthetic protein FliR [Peptococcaceae bacterium]HPZ70602.1 flagellar biosynthetic protein FliR [Peptococcaceae bacterium]HQD53412.1 flagellar biosynthetic protein FliR [Peptococcaceae bacterium]
MDVLAGFLAESNRFFLLLARFCGITFIPVFNTRNIPVQWRVWFLFLLTFFGWMMGLAENAPALEQLGSYTFTLLMELFTGLTLAFIVQLVFAAVQLAGQIIDTQMGFGMMNVVDPLSGTQAPLLGNFKYILAILVFLQIDGHHLFIQAVYDSYRVFPVGESFLLSPNFIPSFVLYFGNVFLIGCKLGMPIVGTLLVTDFVLGVMARTVPQMNIFMVGLQVKILIGFFVLLVTVPLFIYLLNASFSDLFTKIYEIIQYK